jgi:nucleoside-diphosphate-sugar epimerase
VGRIGATGHVGTYLVPRLVRGGHDVVGLSRGLRDPYVPGPWPSITPAGNLDLDVWRWLAMGDPLALPDLALGVLHHVHADDVAQGFERALPRPAAVGSSFHVVSEQAMTLRGTSDPRGLRTG